MWDLIKISVTGCWVCAVLWVTATSFDATEIKAIGGILVGLGGSSVVDWCLRRRGESQRRQLRDALAKALVDIRIAAESARLPDDSVRDIIQTLDETK